jgi:alkylhydroperoxidase/carboxymuconolactone decarboxylase family protein YurZ
VKLPASAELLQDRIATCRPHEYTRPRILAIYAAAIALADENSCSSAIELSQTYYVDPSHLYEIVLQSYLFLGFPRMLEAAEHLTRFVKNADHDYQLRSYSVNESEQWYHNGVSLCRQVYGANYERLKRRVESFAPDIFRWMVVEGYGKVLSRGQLSIQDRELAIIASLMIDQRERQLVSHVRGAINVGVSHYLLRHVADDIGDAAGEGWHMVNRIFRQLGLL